MSHVCTSVCPGVECTVMASIGNGQVTSPTPTLYNDVVAYNCSDGFELVGPRERRCLADGHLNESQPFCQCKSHSQAVPVMLTV